MTSPSPSRASWATRSRGRSWSTAQARPRPRARGQGSLFRPIPRPLPCRPWAGLPALTSSSHSQLCSPVEPAAPCLYCPSQASSPRFFPLSALGRLPVGSKVVAAFIMPCGACHFCNKVSHGGPSPGASAAVSLPTLQVVLPAARLCEGRAGVSLPAGPSPRWPATRFLSRHLGTLCIS